MAPRIRRERRAAAATPPLLFLIAALLGPAPASAQGPPPIAICHATGDPANPFVLIQATQAELLEHLDHENDLVPAPPGGCPAVDEPDPTPTPEPDPYYALPTPVPTLAPAPTSTAEPTAEPRERQRRRRQRDRGDDDAVLPAAAQASPGGGLPLTGAQPLLAGLAGLGMLMAGLGMRLRGRLDGGH